MDRSFSARGVYLLHPIYGMFGVGAMEYDSKKPGEEKFAALQDEVDTVKKILMAIVAKLHDEAIAKKGVGAIHESPLH